MGIESLRINSRVDRRSDSRDLHGYSVVLDNKYYVMYYNLDVLREVYFMSEDVYTDNGIKYFMSVRADMSKVSHYYAHSDINIISRYEDGVRNMSYIIDSNQNMIAIANGEEKRRYTGYYPKQLPDKQKIYDDLTHFLERFEKSGLRELMKPDNLEEELEWKKKYLEEKAQTN